MASKSNHMEYSIWQYIESSGVDSKALHMTSEKRHMEYSIWSLFDAIWSTPCGHYFLPYGVLHMVTVEFIFSRVPPGPGSGPHIPLQHPEQLLGEDGEDGDHRGDQDCE